jgi:hypothetical protein
MSALSIHPTYPIFTDIDGQPLEDGYVWIGTANLDPQTNPITVYFDQALTIVAAQPLRTIGGYIVNSGTPAKIYVDAAAYSIRVMNKNGSVVYSSPTATERYSRVVLDITLTPSNATGDGVQTIFSVASEPLFVYINGVYQNKNTYTFAAGSVTFSEAPPLNAIIEFLI